MYTSLHTRKIIPDISENLKTLKQMYIHHYVFILVSQITKDFVALNSETSYKIYALYTFA